MSTLEMSTPKISTSQNVNSQDSTLWQNVGTLPVDCSTNRKFWSISSLHFVCGAWDYVMQDLEEIDILDDFMTCFDSTHTVITTTLELPFLWWLTQLLYTWLAYTCNWIRIEDPFKHLRASSRESRLSLKWSYSWNLNFVEVDILGVHILGVNIFWGVDILRVDIDILGVDIFGGVDILGVHTLRLALQKSAV